MTLASSVEAKFFARVGSVVGPDDCWPWIGYVAHNGYGVFHHRNKRLQAHRWSYEFLRDEIPTGLVIDHLCRVRSCVNAWHLEPVTSVVNTRRGMHPDVVTYRSGHCERGHLVVDWRANGGSRKNCAECRRMRYAEHAKDPAWLAARAAYAVEQRRRLALARRAAP